MNNYNRFLRIAVSVLLAVLMAGSSVQVILTAAGVPALPSLCWLPVLAAGLLCGIGAWSGLFSALAWGAALLAGGAFVLSRRGDLASLKTLLTALIEMQEEIDPALVRTAAGLLAPLLAAALAAGAFSLIHQSGGTSFALLIHAAILIAAYAMKPELDLMAAIPGLIGGLAAFILSGTMQRGTSSWKALAMAMLAVAVAMAVLPRQGATWEPLENAARMARSIFEDYFRFTEERIPFTITTEGYNHAVEDNGIVVARLGGPADPDTTPVMKVSADRDILLRATIRRTYTGYSWIDTDAKARYLYIDFTRLSERAGILGMSGNDVLEKAGVQVEYLADGTSALFVPSRMSDFSMPLEDAVYYNTIGEMFLTRPARPGDRYSLTGYTVGSRGSELRAAVIAAEASGTAVPGEVLDHCLQLPEFVEDGVVELTREIVSGCANDYDRAAAIERWLRMNCRYTLTPDMPSYDRDFVSQFVLTDREGYCSYFASAMTIMCRIAGVPARYVEGYSVRTDGAAPVLLTGENAHAWTEVWLRGVGWISFDATNGGSGGDPGNGAGEDAGDRSGSGSGDGDAGAGTAPESEPTPTPTPAPESEPPEGGSGNGQTDQSGQENAPTPTPEPQAAQPESPEPPPEPPKHSRDLRWLWVLIALLLVLLALAAVWLKRRLRDADPVRLAAAARNEEQASLVLYRSILTLLSVQGMAPLGSEPPGTFARRIARETGNETFVAFADAVALSAYAGGSVKTGSAKTGLKAYRGFLAGMKRGERLRFAVRRIIRGLGRFDAIP